MTINVSLELDIETLKPAENGNIQMLLRGTSASISITSTEDNYVIDWGDGSTEQASGTGSKTYSHTYTDNSLFQVEVSNHTGITSCIGSTSCLIAYWSIGNSAVKDITFSGYSKLKYFGNVFKNDSDRTNANSLLSYCSSLTSVDLTPLAGWTNVTDASYMFYNCSSLTSVDLTSLAGWTNVTNASYMFYNCSILTSVDLTPLAGWTKMISNLSLISSCSKLTFISVLADIPFTLSSSSSLTNGNSCPIYVPDSAVDVYKSATNWSAYSSRIKPISEKQ